MPQQRQGRAARDYLRMRRPIGSPVHLEVKVTDRSGRTVAEVFSGSNITRR